MLRKLLLMLSFLSFSLQEEGIKKVSIKRIDKDESKLPVNPYANQCGGSGELVSQYNSLCNASSPTAANSTTNATDDADTSTSITTAATPANSLCKFTERGNATIETNFLPSRDYEGLGLRVSTSPDGGNFWELEYVGTMNNSKVTKGQLHQLHSVIIPSTAHKTVVVHYEIFDPEVTAIELCVEAKFQFEKPEQNDNETESSTAIPSNSTTSKPLNSTAAKSPNSTTLKPPVSTTLKPK